jgi:hypothetical protein
MTGKDEFFEFWGEPISVYTDEDAQADGTVIDTSVFEAAFNGKIINRATIGASGVLGICDLDGLVVKKNLEYIAENCKKDREGADAWGIFEPDARLGNTKLWLVYNEVGGYTVMKPEEY